MKNRVNKITDQLQLVQIETASDTGEVLDMLESGEISAEEAAERLQR